MTSKRRPSKGSTGASAAVTKGRRREATPPPTSDSESEDDRRAPTPAKKPRKTVLEITPGAGVHIWTRKGDGPKHGLTKEALDLWLQPITIKKDSNPEAKVRYSSLIGGCLKPQLASLLGIADTDAGWLSIDNADFPSRVRLAIEPSTDYESLLSNLKLEAYFDQARKKHEKKAPFILRSGEDPALFDQDFKIPLTMFDLLTGDFLQLAKEDKDTNQVPVSQRKLVETLILACKFSEFVSSTVSSNRTDDLASTVRLTRAQLQKKESWQLVAAKTFFQPTPQPQLPSPPQVATGALFNILEMMRGRPTTPSAAEHVAAVTATSKPPCCFCGWSNHDHKDCLRKAWPGANLSGSQFPAGKQRLTLENCFPDATLRKKIRDEERHAIRAKKRTDSHAGSRFNQLESSHYKPEEVLAFLNSIVPSLTAVNPSDYALRGLAVRRTAVGALAVDALWDNGANICYIDPDLASNIVRAGNGRIRQLKHRVLVTQGAIRTPGFDQLLFCDVTLVHRGIKHKIYDQMFAVYATGHAAVIGSDVLETQTGIIDVRKPGVDDDRLVQEAVDRKQIKSPNLSPNTIFLATAVAAVLREEEWNRGDERVAASLKQEWHQGDKHGSSSNVAIVERLKHLYPDPFDDDFSAAAKFEEYSILLEKELKIGSVQSQKYTPAMLTEMQRQLLELVRIGVICKCDTVPKFLSPVLMVMQKNKIRMCINYKKLNMYCNARAYCMPDLQCSVDELKGFKFYASFDLKKCYNQFLIKEADRTYAAFSTPFGNFMPTRVQFGFQGAPAFVQSHLSEALRTFPGCADFRLFIDDAAVGANSMEELNAKCESFLKFCMHYNLKLQADKVQIGVRELKYLGMVVCERGKFLDPSRIDALLDIRKPRSVREVKQLLGAFNWIRLWIPNMSQICKPFYAMTEGYAKKKLMDKSKFVWSALHDRAFTQLKESVRAAPMLAKLDYDRQIFVRTDASQWGMGGVIFQLEVGTKKPLPLGYFSRCFTPQEQKYSVPDQEMMAIKETIEKFEHMLLGHRFVVQTDALNLRSMFSSEVSRIVRSRLAITRHNFEIQHISGEKDNQVCDGISRLHQQPVEAVSDISGVIGVDGSTFSVGVSTSDEQILRTIQVGKYAESAKIPFVGTYLTPVDMYSNTDITHPEFLELQADWVECSTGTYQEIIANMNTFEPKDHGLVPVVQEPQHEPKDRRLVTVVQELAREAPDAALSCPTSASVTSTTQTEPADFLRTLPLQTCENVFNAVHSSKSGHWGEAETFRRVMAAEPTLQYSQTRAECAALVKSCAICQKIRGLDSKVKIRFSSITKQPWEEICIDTLTFSEPDLDGCRYMVVIVDSFTRLTEMFAVRDTTSETVTQCLLQVYSRYGSPTTIRCDGGPQFRSELMRKFHELTNVKVLQVIPYHPQANGKVESRQGQVMRHLRAMVLSDSLGPNTSYSWSRLIPFVFNIINNSIHSATCCTPNSLMFGIHGMSNPKLLPQQPFEGTTFEYLAQHIKHQEKLLKLSEDHQSQMLTAAARAQGTSPTRELHEGQFVLLRAAVAGKTTKLNCKWLGPFIVMDRVDSKAPLVHIFDMSNRRVREAHMQDLVVFDMARTTVMEAERLAAADSFEYTVEKILDHKCTTSQKNKKSDYSFLVKWLNYDETSWEPYDNVKYNILVTKYAEEHNLTMFMKK